MRLSDARDARRAVRPTGRVGASAAMPSGDSLTSTRSPPATGELARALLPPGGCHDAVPGAAGVLSADAVRDSGRCCSMVTREPRGGAGGELEGLAGGRTTMLFPGGRVRSPMTSAALPLLCCMGHGHAGVTARHRVWCSLDSLDWALEHAAYHAATPETHVCDRR